MAKAPKKKGAYSRRSSPSATVSTNFKQNHKRKAPGSAGGTRARSSGGGTGKNTGDFDPDQNVRQVNEDMAAAPEAAQALGSMPSQDMPAPAMPPEPSGLGQRSIPRYPDEEMV